MRLLAVTKIDSENIESKNYSSLSKFMNQTMFIFQNMYKIQYIVTFTTLFANSADDKLVIFFLINYFPRKPDLTFRANCLHWR